jgi:signal transduction histidine kinase
MPHPIVLTRRLVRGATLIAGVICFLVLVLWAFGLGVPRTTMSGVMKVNTALALLATAIAVGLLSVPKPRSAGRSPIALALALGAWLMGALVAVQYGLHVDLGVDQWLITDHPLAESMNFPGRMSPITAALLILLGSSLLVYQFPRTRRRALHQPLALIGALMCIFALVGYIYDVSSLYSFGPYIRISSYTATCGLLLAWAIIALDPAVGVMRVLTSTLPGGATSRRLLAAAFLIPPVVGWLRLKGQAMGFYTVSQGTSFSVITYMTLFGTLIYLSAVRINAVTGELQKAVRTRDEFLSIASHELKTPLTSLKLQTQLCQREVAASRGGTLSPERLQSLLERTERQADRITRLVDDILDVSRIELGKLQIEKESFDLTALVRDVIEQLQAEATQVGSPIRLASDPGPLPGMWDRFRLEQVVLNLLTNAIKYGAGKPVDVRIFRAGLAGREGQGVRLEVQDQGRGVLPENREKIFARFERADADGDKIPGLGLGLYIVRQIVRLHGGTIHVEGERGSGATFVVQLV